jgi:hypothetical protein
MRCSARRPSRPSRPRLNLEWLEDRLAPSVLLGQQPGAPNTTQFHGDAARTGFNQNETFLTPANVASSFGQVWQSPVLDGHLYASPLYQDSILIQGNGNAANHAGDGVQSPSFQGKTLGVVFAATGGGTVYAIAAQDTNGTTGIAPGTILWKTHLGNPYGGIDGNSIGVLSTPIIDVASNRIYVTGSVTDYLLPAGNPNHGGNNWEVFALNLSDGSLVSGWPLAFTQSLLDSLNQNTLNGAGVAVPFSSAGGDQRGALALSPDGSILYVDFAAYGSSNPGWMTTVATGVTNGVSNGQNPAVVSSYSGNDTTTTNANAGMWGAGGPAVDAAGNVFVSTGDSPSGTGQTPGAWGNSVLEWGPGQTLTLTGVYSPWNYQTQDTIDSDLGGGSPILINLPAGSSTTTELLAVGGKQGNGYLLNAGNHLNNPTPNPNGSPASYPASLTTRPPVVNPNQDPSLYDPNAIRPYFNPPQAGPLALFGPYNETSASGNTAKARDTPATFIGPDGTRYVIWAGSSKAAVGSGTPVAPSLYLTKVVASPGQPAFLQIVTQNTQVMSLSGANIITANGTANPIEWIVDAGVQRTNGETNFSNGAPTLYAYNALTLQPLWSSAYQQLDMGGRYNTIAAARGQVFVGTDRIQAFGLTNDTIVDDSVQGTGPNQFQYTGSGWTHAATTSMMGAFDGTLSTDNVAGDFATLTFTGSRIRVYAGEASGYGSVTITIDGANAQTVSLANTTNSPNGQGEGDVLVYTLSGLGAGTHTLRFQNNGTATVALDRVEITPLATASSALGVSLTEGNITPVAGQILPYTINFNNAGSMIDGTGTNATGVVVTETVPANTTADLANSTPGWTLTSGTGGAGSTYTFSVGALNAGVTGSVVFTVDVNSTIPTGTTTLTNTVTITDAASDSNSATRVTPLGTPVATSLAFVQQPGNGETGVALTPAVTVAVKDQFGNTFTGDNSSTVTLTLNGGTFVGGGNTATATVSSGVATFNNLAISAAGSYTLTATDGSLTSATSNSFTIQTPTKLAFTQQPGNGVIGTPLAPPIAVAVQDAAGNTVTGDSSTVTLTLSSGAFASGSNTATATAVNGVASFGGLVINTAGTYTLAASDGTLTGATSASFAVTAGTSVYLDFNSGASSFTSNFTVYNNGGASNTSLVWGSNFGIRDQAGGAAGGGIQSTSGVAIDSTAVYTPSRVNLSDGAVHTISEYVTAVTGLTAGNKPVQIGFLAPGSTGFNAGFNFISARILGNGTVEFQSANGGTAVSTNNTTPTGTINTGDWLDLIFTTRETASGSFTGTFSLIDYGPTGRGAGTTVLAPVSYTVTGLTGMGTASAVSPGFRVALPPTFTSQVVGYDNFAVDPPGPAKLDYFQQPTSGTAGVALSPFVVAVEDIAGHTVSTDASTVTLTLSHGTFANGATSVTAPSVNGVATFNNLVINAPGSYVLRATDTNPNLDPGYAPFTINPSSSSATQLAFVQQPSNVTAGTAISPAVTVAVEDATGATVTSDTSTVTLTLSSGTFAGGSNTVSAAAVNGVATFSNLVINTPGSYTLAASDGTLTGATSSSFAVSAGVASKLAFVQQPSNATASAAISPAVTVAVQDAGGNTVTSDTSTVTLTLSSGTFAGGSNTVSAAAVNGVATFSNLVINTAGSYTLAASDGSLTGATSNAFTISAGSSIFIDFNSGAASFTSNFKVYNNGGANNTSLAWGATFGINDQTGGTAGGGVQSSGGVAIDSTAVYTPSTVNLSDGLVHTISEYVTAVQPLGTGNKPLQLGFLAPTSTGFNTGFNFISARILGNDTVEFQYANGGAAVSSHNTTPTGTINVGDWLKLIFTTQETASGSFQGTFSLIDYGPTGVGTGTTVLAPVSYTITGLTGLGTASAVSPGFRTALPASFTGHVRFDNFVDPPSTGKTGTHVSLAGAFNQVGIVRDGSKFTGGLDGGNSSLSASLLGASLIWNGTLFTLGAAGGNNVVSAAGQTIALPAGRFSTLTFLGTAVDGNQPSQTFVVTYVDGTTDTFTQGVSDWFTPRNYAGESDAVDLAYRDLSNGTKDNRTFHVYGYRFALNPAKTVKSIRLPNNGKVKILAVTLT